MMKSVEDANRKLKWIVIRFVVAVVIAIALGVGLAVREGQKSQELKEALIENCEKGPVRASLNESLRLEVKEDEHPEKPILEALHISERKAIELAKPRVKKLKERLSQIEPSDCATQYNR